ncbi:uncharacterized protein LOC142973699 [Anticarsia gemmatalis]|uniref:uncharacterized protein LOC142973699 n=1 Tax=Anticarsia gemmatalis TaxID=129554 RepID=UPI003F771F0A
MEIYRWLCYIIINCLLIQYREAKSVSLNELIAAESRDKPVAVKSPRSRFENRPYDTAFVKKRISLSEITSGESQEEQPRKYSTRKFTGLSKRFPLFERLISSSKSKGFKADKIIPEDKKISPLQYRKTFQIKSPLKPAKLKYTPGSRFKRRNQSKKREISGNEHLKQKYIPLLKSLSMLFDNLLNTDESQSHEITTKKYKRNRFYSEERFENSWERSDKSIPDVTQFRSPKKTTTSSPPLSFEISSNAEDLSPGNDHDQRSFRSNKIIPVLLSRNTSGFRRNNNGISKRSGTTHNRYFERNIAGDHGDHEHNTGCGENESCAESNEKDTNSVTRDDASGIRHSRTDGIRNSTRNSKDRKTTNNFSQNENTDDNNRQNQFEAGRDAIEGEKLLREPVRELRGHTSEDEITADRLPEPIRAEEIRKESVFGTTHNSSSDKRITHESSPLATKDEKIRSRNETVIVIERNSRNGNNIKHSGKKSPVVMIFDGYSVTRDKNGENKITGKTIHIHS